MAYEVDRHYSATLLAKVVIDERAGVTLGAKPY
jgi:hypothetical protein